MKITAISNLHGTLPKNLPGGDVLCICGDIVPLEWLLDLWRSSVDKRDDVFILGDLMFLKSEDARHLLEKLPGRKHLVEGNHDGSIRAYHNYFTSVHQILNIDIKQSRCPFVEQTLRLSMCHYPMVTWNHKPRGSVMLHGHCHGKLDEHNALSPDLRFDVGIDGTLSRTIGKENGSGFALIDIEHLYEATCSKAGSTDLASYANASYKTEEVLSGISHRPFCALRLSMPSAAKATMLTSSKAARAKIFLTKTKD